MNDFLMAGKCAELAEKLNDLINIANRRTKAERQKVIEATALGSFDLSADEIKVLCTMHALAGKVTLKRLVSTLISLKGEGVYSSTVSTTMARFKKNGLLSQEDNENDRRQPLNYLTPKGEELARRLGEVDAMALRNIIGCLQLDDALATNLTQRVGRASERINEQLQRLQKQTKPSIAGVYDYVLGGTWNTVVDRMFIEGNNIPPQRRQNARANRAFLQRVVYFLAKEKGITQFIDIGSGFPTNRNTHHVVLDLELKVMPRITYVDNDPEVVMASRSLLAEAKDLRVAENVRVAEEDLRSIKNWLTPARFQNIDLKKPVAVLLVAVLHFLTDDSEVRDILQFLKQRLAPGSYLAISHSAPGPNTEVERPLVASYNSQVSKIELRTRQRLKELLQGFKLQDPEPVLISDWKPELPDMLSKGDISSENSTLLACVVKI